MSHETDSEARISILSRLVTLGLLAVVLIAPTQYSFEIREKTYLSIVDPLLWIVGVLWIVDLAISRRLRTIKLPPVVTILFVAAAMLSVLKAENRFASLKDIFQIVEYFIAAFLLFSCAIRDRAQLKVVLDVFMGVTTAVVFLGLRQYLAPCREAFNVGATFGNRNVLGGYLSLALPAIFGLMLYERHWGRLLWYAITLVVGALIVLSGGTAVAVVLALCILAMLKSQRAFAILLVVLAVGMVVVMPKLARDNGGVLRESISIYDEDGNASKRYPEWQAGIEMIRENRLLGVGIGNYQSSVGMYYGSIPSRPEASEADTQNMFIVLASTIGLPGAALFLGMLFLFGCNAARCYFRAGADRFQRGLALGLLGSLVAFSINCIWSPLLVRGIGIPLALVFALGVVLGRLPTEEGSAKI